MKIDQTNSDPDYWEKILAAQKLELLEPENEEESDQVSIESETNHGRRVREGNRDMEKLYEKFDGRDGFFTGHQINKLRIRKVKVPEWPFDNSKLRNLIETTFPNFRSSSQQKQRAGRWALVIHLYYRMGMTHGRIAKETNDSPTQIKLVLQRIRKAAEKMGYKD